MKIRIRSDGTGPITNVVVVDEAGVEHPLKTPVLSASWSCNADEAATATLALHGVEVDVVGEVEE